ncbi:site-determining protein [Tistrella bauzanensis]|uniref:Site-determining protein n=1 Tax=Tistrella bauzanensis TaxID=657419 RepID=A0ABQ1IFU3_9PROT|nr:MinD/ParA family protein [Tistrella bauzanensis]GGB39105.1 site-determining protein [Tistrella bauzanensis]
MNVDRSVHIHPAAKLRARNIIAIASGKGGVGKTWLSITLAGALARRGRRVLLFDGDLGLANVDVQLGLTPAADLAGVVTGRVGFSEAIFSYQAGGFDILPGRSGSGSLGRLPSDRLGMLRLGLVQAARSYDTVLIDLAAGLDQSVRALAATAGTGLVVTNDEPTSITDAYAFVKAMLRDNPEADQRIVVNMAETQSGGLRTYETLRNAAHNFLGVEPKLAGIIRRDKMVREAIRRQTPLTVRHPNAPAAMDVDKIAAHLML